MAETLEKKMDELSQYDLTPEAGTYPADEPKKPVKPVAAEPETPPAKPQWLLATARKLGFNQADVDGMSVEDLKSAVSTVAQTQAATRSQQADDASLNRRQPKEPEPEPDFDSLAELGIDPTKWNEDTPTADVLKSVTKPMLKRIKELEARDKARREQDEARETYSRLDKLFASRKDWYGDGSQDDVDPDSDFMDRRQSAIASMRRRLNANPNQSLKQVFDAVTGALAPATKSEVNDDPKGLRNGATLKPTARSTAEPPKGVKAAEEAVRLKKREIEERTAHQGAEEDDLSD